jgi:hypothetical protein
MSKKQYKKLRALTGFVPQEPRQYEDKVVKRVRDSKGEVVEVTQRVNIPSSPRARYQAAKRGLR